ncbi:hypothetical protein TGPRC2_239690, partial [Toxoplasma gondii TgCatPRC2]
RLSSCGLWSTTSSTSSRHFSFFYSKRALALGRPPSLGILPGQVLSSPPVSSSSLFCIWVSSRVCKGFFV